MSIQMKLAVKGNLQRAIDADALAGKRAVTKSVRQRTNTGRNLIRRHVKRSLQGANVDKTVRGDAYPSARNPSANAKGKVYSNLVRNQHDVFYAFVQGRQIRPRNGEWLRIPTPLGRRFASGRTWRGGRANYPGAITITSRDGNSRRVVDRRNRNVIFEWQVKAAALPKRIPDPGPLLSQHWSKIPELITKNWDQETIKEFQRQGIR